MLDNVPVRKVFWEVGNLALFPTMYFQCPMWAPVSICLSCLSCGSKPSPLSINCKLSIRHSARESPAISERVWWAGVCCRSVRLAKKLVVFSWVHCCTASSRTFYRRHKQVDQFLHHSMHPSWSARMFAGFRKLKFSIFGQRSFLRGWFDGCQ